MPRDKPLFLRGMLFLGGSAALEGLSFFQAGAEDRNE
jgi:hypothetical protein